MNKFKRALAIATIVGAVGFSYALYTLRGLPDAFDLEGDECE
jgi:hypothetical protein